MEWFRCPRHCCPGSVVCGGSAGGPRHGSGQRRIQPAAAGGCCQRGAGAASQRSGAHEAQGCVEPTLISQGRGYGAAGVSPDLGQAQRGRKGIPLAQMVLLVLSCHQGCRFRLRLNKGCNQNGLGLLSLALLDAAKAVKRFRRGAAQHGPGQCSVQTAAVDASSQRAAGAATQQCRADMAQRRVEAAIVVQGRSNRAASMAPDLSHA
mmetsp:Transcript_11634/g.29347  ORF Transcript_11634/g.29347 Transcript_11634/m.29347 type:complete len:207 (+) Transcript_11634:2060-2680(+)